MSTPLLLPSPRVDAIGYHSRILFHWRADRMRLTALGGEAATLTRASDATVNDSAGTSRTVGHHQSAWTWIDSNGDAAVDAPALWLSRVASGKTVADLLSWPFLAPPQAMTLYVRFVENGTIALANARVLTIGSAALGTPYLYVFSNGTTYRAEHHNGSSAVTAALGAAPTTGNRVELRVVLAANGAVTIGQSINGAAETTATSSALALSAAWSATTLWLNGEAAATAGNGYYRTLKVSAGVRTLTDMQLRAW
jgi:hypothetical protein